MRRLRKSCDVRCKRDEGTDEDQGDANTRRSLRPARYLTIASIVSAPRRALNRERVVVLTTSVEMGTS